MNAASWDKCRRPAFGKQPIPGRFEQLRDALSAHGGDPEERQSKLVRPPGKPGHPAFVVEGVDLVRGHDLRLGRQFRPEQLQLAADGVEVADRIAPLPPLMSRGGEDLRAFEMAQELMPAAEAAVGSSIKPGKARHEAAIALRLTTRDWASAS